MSAFRSLVGKYKDVSFSLACSVLHDEYEAEDALQESFIKVYRNIHKFRFQSSFSTWVYKIVVNTCFTIAKKQKKHLHDDIDSCTGIELQQSKTGFEELIESEQKAIINKVLKMIKPEEALLLRLFYLSDLDVKEIMEVTGFRESKIKVTLHRARKNALNELQKNFVNELTQIV